MPWTSERTRAVAQGYRAPYDVYPGAASYGTGPRSTPVVDDGRLFTLGIGGILSAFDSGSGRILWQKDFTGRFPAPAPPFGTSMSPLVAAGLLIVHAGGHEGGALIAFDPASGAEKWTLPGDGPSYSSPILTTLLGQQQLVIQVHRRILGVDPSSGRCCGAFPSSLPATRTSSRRFGPAIGSSCRASTREHGDRAPQAATNGPPTAWHTTEVSMYMSSPVLADGRVLGLSHKQARANSSRSIPRPAPSRGRVTGGQGENAAFVLAGDSVLVLQGDGNLLALARDASTFAPTRQYRVADSATYAHPVPTAKGLLIKDENGLALYGPAATSKAAAGPGR